MFLCFTGLVILERYQDNEDKQLSEKAEKIIDICMQNVRFLHAFIYMKILLSHFLSPA